MEIAIYRRHRADCKHQEDRYAPRCGCPLWFQFNWPQASTSLDGKKLRHGQNKWSADTRTWAQAQRNSLKLERDLNAVIEGKPVRNTVTVTAAVNEWLEFRTKNGLTNAKPKLMGDKLTAWCEQNSVLLLSAISTDLVIKFRMSLPFRTVDSSSLSVHWAVIGGFFNWAVGMGYIDKTPVPNSRQNPQFRIRYAKKEVVPPTKAEVETIVNTTTGKVNVLATLMRETGMALVDAQKFDPATLQDGTLIRGNRTKTGERYRVRISQ